MATPVTHPTTVRLTDEQKETIEQIVRESGATPEVPVMGKSKVIRLLLDEGIAAVERGDLVDDEARELHELLE